MLFKLPSWLAKSMPYKLLAVPSPVVLTAIPAEVTADGFCASGMNWKLKNSLSPITRQLLESAARAAKLWAPAKTFKHDESANAVLTDTIIPTNSKPKVSRDCMLSISLHMIATKAKYG